MPLEDCSLNEILSDIGRTAPRFSGSTSALIAAQLGIAMAKMALVVSSNHGFDNRITVALVDSLASDVKAAAKRDQSASAALIEIDKGSCNTDDLLRARMNATREPLAAAHVLIETLELVWRDADQIDASVASDFYGGIELISAAFSAVMMAIETNLAADGMENLLQRTEGDRSRLRNKHTEFSKNKPLHTARDQFQRDFR